MIKFVLKLIIITLIGILIGFTCERKTKGPTLQKEPPIYDNLILKNIGS